MGEEVDEVEVLEEERAVVANALGRLGVEDRAAIAGGVDGGFVLFSSVCHSGSWSGRGRGYPAPSLAPRGVANSHPFQTSFLLLNCKFRLEGSIKMAILPTLY